MKDPGIELEGSYSNTKSDSHFDKWYGDGGVAWSSVAEALSKIPQNKRHGTTIGVLTNGIIKEYWWPDAAKLGDSDLVLKLTEPVDTNRFYTTDQADQKFYNKTQSDERYASSDSVRESYVSKLEYSVQRSEDQVKSDLMQEQIDGKSSKDDLAIQVAAVLAEIDNRFSSVLRNWVDPIEFVYDGVNNVFDTSFEAIEPDLSMITYDNVSKPLNPLYDYFHSGKTITFRNGVLIPGKKYFLLLKYLK